MGFMKALSLLLAIPVFGFGVSIWILSDFNRTLAEQGSQQTVQTLCQPEVLAQLPGLTPVCDQVAPILWMQTGSLASAAVAAVLLLSFIVLATVAGNNRIRVAAIFPPLVLLTLLILAVLVVIQGAILTYGAYLVESHLVGRAHFYLIGGIGLGALLGGFGLIKSSFRLVKKQASSVLGARLIPEEHPRLFSLIKEIANKLGARNPDHVVVGLDPNFFATSADVNIVGESTSLKGETLYLSLPLARILTQQELTAIIGHELGHFRGADTYYSLKFSPVYAGLMQALTSLEGDDDESETTALATLPAYVVLSYIIDVFGTNISTISREREFEADKAAAEVGDPVALASSLLKLGLYYDAWHDLQDRIVERLQAGKVACNMSQLFASIVKYDVNKETIPEVIDTIAQQTVTHPTDSHPPTALRIAELGVALADIDHDSLILPEQSCIELIDQPLAIEEKLTALQQQYYVAMGVRVPEENQNPGSTLLAAFGARMVVADGRIEADEIDKAEAEGRELSGDFDVVEFREFCHYPDSIPSIDELLAIAADISGEGKTLIYDFLQTIAGADGDVSPEELAILNRVKAAFGL